MGRSVPPAEHGSRSENFRPIAPTEHHRGADTAGVEPVTERRAKLFAPSSANGAPGAVGQFDWFHPCAIRSDIRGRRTTVRKSDARVTASSLEPGPTTPERPSWLAFGLSRGLPPSRQRGLSHMRGLFFGDAGAMEGPRPSPSQLSHVRSGVLIS